MGNKPSIQFLHSKNRTKYKLILRSIEFSSDQPWNLIKLINIPLLDPPTISANPINVQFT